MNGEIEAKVCKKWSQSLFRSALPAFWLRSPWQWGSCKVYWPDFISSQTFIPGKLLQLFVCPGASLVVQTVKNVPAMQDSQVQSLCQEDPLEKGMAIHSSILPWRIPWTEEPGGLQSMGLLLVMYCFKHFWWILFWCSQWFCTVHVTSLTLWIGNMRHKEA